MSLPCSNEDYVPFHNPLNVRADKVEEHKLLEALKRDNVVVLITFFYDKSSRVLNRTLTEGYPGNTIP